jgi:hypothetical protein
VPDPALAPVLDALLIEGFDALDLAAYEPALALKRYALALGYPALG